MNFVIGLDQGTTSTRAIVYARDGTEQGRSQVEHRQHYPRPGWAEHDALEILDNARRVLTEAVERAGLTSHDIAAVGITNQTETTVLWDRQTGQPIANAITWQDTRGEEVLAELILDGPASAQVETECMVSPNGYFSATKIRWLLDHVPEARDLAEQGRLAFGSIDCWLCWNLTGGPAGGVHVTDVTNASRTLLMDMRALRWSPRALDFFGIPPSLLPEIVPTSHDIGAISAGEPLEGVRITALMGDQQAAAFGQTAFGPGEAKCTYGTGNFLIYNTGTEPRRSTNGLITTVVYRLGEEAPVYGLEGSVAVTGSLIQWLRDSLELIEDASDTERIARSVPDSGGVSIVPAFSGLYAPHWHPHARGTIVGLTHHARTAHLVRAALESTALQTHDLIEAARADTDTRLGILRVDGGMTSNELLMQFQADVLGVPVSRPAIVETTSLGVAYNAGLAVGIWSGLDELRALWRENAHWEPQLSQTERSAALERWHRALRATMADEPGTGASVPVAEPA